MQNTILKQPHIHRKRMKISGLKSAIIAIALGVEK